MLISLPEARHRQAVERRDPRRDAGGRRAAAAGAHRRGPDVPARHVGDHRRARDRQRLPGRGRRRDAALRVARLDGGRRVRRRAAPASTRRSGATPSRCCRRSAAPGFSSVIFRLADPDRFDAVKAATRVRPAAARSRPSARRSSTPSSREALSKFISYLGMTISVIFSIGAIIGAMITMYASVASRTGRDRHAARAGLLARGDPGGVPRRGAAARARRRRRRAAGRVVRCRRCRSRRSTSRPSPSSRSASR